MEKMRSFAASFFVDLFPEFFEDTENLKEIKEELEKLKEEGKELLVIARWSLSVQLDGNKLYICPHLASAALERKVKSDEELSFEEAYKVISWLDERWQKFLDYAEKRGWTYKDERGKKHFVWEKDVWFIPGEECERELKEIKEGLEKVKERGAENLLQIWTVDGNIFSWYGRTIIVNMAWASAILGRKVRAGKKLSVGKLHKLIEKALEVRERNDLRKRDQELERLLGGIRGARGDRGSLFSGGLPSSVSRGSQRREESEKSH